MTMAKVKTHNVNQDQILAAVTTTTTANATSTGCSVGSGSPGLLFQFTVLRIWSKFPKVYFGII